MGHLVNAGAGFLQLAQQLIALVQLFVAIGITVHLELGPGELVVGIVLIHLGEPQITIHTLIGKGDLYNLSIFLHGNGDHFIGEDEPFRAFQLFQHPIPVGDACEGEAAVLR